MPAINDAFTVLNNTSFIFSGIHTNSDRAEFFNTFYYFTFNKGSFQKKKYREKSENGLLGGG